HTKHAQTSIGEKVFFLRSCEEPSKPIEYRLQINSKMALFGLILYCLFYIGLLFNRLCFAGDPFANFELDFSYMTVSPLGVPQQVIAVNGNFPGPTLNVTTNYNVVVNVKNKLDESLLITWPGVEMRRASWQDGVLGTNCPIPAKWNWTYQFQVKDQIGSYYYVPSLSFQRAAGGFGGFIITNRKIISLPFNTPDGDIVITIGDWYTRSHKELRASLDDGKELGMPDGVLINGKGPFKYNSSVPDGIEHETVNVDPGKTYRIRVINVGVSTCLNFRIQSHNLLLAEAEGHYTSQQNYTSLDIHVGQSYSFLVTMDQNASSDYYIVASARFVNQSEWQRVTGVAILHYSNAKGQASGPLPDPPNDVFDNSFALNQAMSIRMAYGEWTENSRGSYNRWDAIARSTTQVFPGGWTAILVYLDNVGAWNLRAVNLDRWYLGQETYMRIINPEDDGQKTESPPPDNVLFCGALSHFQKYNLLNIWPQKALSSAAFSIQEPLKLKSNFLVALAAVIYMMI
ncbi:Cupredoxin, partial [Cynara cardunculus var. scolymus]